MSSTLSAVIVAFRSADHLPALIHDLESQGVEEIIVVDNDSPDDSAAVAAAASQRVQIIEMVKNSGYAAGVNAGAKKAGGDHLLLVNPDVRLVPGCIDALRAAAQRRPGTLLGPLVRDTNGRILPTRRSLPSVWSLLGEEVVVRERARPGRWPQRLWARWRAYDAEVDAPILSGVCLLVPREVWESVGPMDEGYFLYWEEVDWQLRARVRGHRTVLVPEAAVEHVRSASLGLNDPRRADLMARSTRRFTAAHLEGWRRPAGRALLLAGQLARWLAWAGPLRRRSSSFPRRAQHAAWVRAFLDAGDHG